MGEGIILTVFIGLGIVMILILAFSYIKDLESSSKLKMYEKSIEDLNMQLFKLQKKLKEREVKDALPGNDIDEIVKRELNKEIIKIDTRVKNAISSLENEIDELKKDIEERHYNMDEKIKEVGYIPTSTQNVDEGRILSMHSSGYSAEDIARELRISRGEVEFTLKLANI